ncbi:MAG TPA: AAA family ATPase, partial [Coriobacteriia bacterium]|nr:AAA family ATPase [Coriobacteriia bacterium]
QRRNQGPEVEDPDRPAPHPRPNQKSHTYGPIRCHQKADRWIEVQSVLLMHLLIGDGGEGQRELLLLEEPEAFLHPSAQRTVARQLFDAEDLRLIISTHSTVVVDESVAADVVLVRGHRVFSPTDVDQQRVQINSALLTGQGSEAIFSRSVLLVEGPGDRAFFERLRRRFSALVPVGVLSSLGIVAVGGKTRFAPWIQLLGSYLDRHSGFRPIDFLVVADSADACTDVSRGFRDAGLSLPTAIGRLVSATSAAFSSGDVQGGIGQSQALNSASEREGFPMAFLPVDLEYAALSRASEVTLAALESHLHLGTNDRDALMSRLGSKFAGAPVASPRKEDWIRAEIAATLPLTELSAGVRLVLRRWLSPALDDAGLALPELLLQTVGEA